MVPRVVRFQLPTWRPDRRPWLLDVAGSSPGHGRHLGTESEGEESPCLFSSAFQINNKGNKRRIASIVLIILLNCLLND